MDDSLRTQLERYHSGSNIRAYEFLGCHPETRDGQAGFVFRVWAPNAQGEIGRASCRERVSRSV